ncbi:MAG: proton/glutamate symporter, partial [Clostridia bacterium]|nr:proton/glutamate symporter [Clostridia bacterium]
MKSGKWFVKNLGVLIIVAMFLGILAGVIMGERAEVFRPLGDLFVQLIKMVVIPLVAVSIIGGAASIGNGKSAGKIGVTTFAYYLGTTVIAVILGLIAGEIFKPGAGIPIDSINSMFSNEYADQGSLPGFWETLKGIVPANPIQALVDGNILQILFFSLFLGFGISSVKEDKRVYLTNALDALGDALVFVILKIMYIAPIGVFALMADATGTFGFSILGLVLKLFV